MDVAALDERIAELDRQILPLIEERNRLYREWLSLPYEVVYRYHHHLGEDDPVPPLEDVHESY